MYPFYKRVPDDAMSYTSSQLQPSRYDSIRSSQRASSQPRWFYFDYDEPEKNYSGQETFANEYYRAFITGSSYNGKWNSLGMNGNGRYTMMHGVVYEGGMKDGQFHGEGKLIYPKGQEISGQFYKGTMISSIFTFKDGKACRMENYCRFPDRRYLSELVKGKLLPPGQEKLTSSKVPRKIPKGHYDAGDGFYDPKTKWVYRYPETDDGSLFPSRAPLRFVKPIESELYDSEGAYLLKKLPFLPIYGDEEFIVKNCRKAWNEPTGYRPDLYEIWANGRKIKPKKIKPKQKEAKPQNRDEDDSASIKLLHYMEEIVRKTGEARLRHSHQMSIDDRSKSIA